MSLLYVWMLICQTIGIWTNVVAHVSSCISHSWEAAKRDERVSERAQSTAGKSSGALWDRSGTENRWEVLTVTVKASCSTRRVVELLETIPKPFQLNLFFLQTFISEKKISSPLLFRWIAILSLASVRAVSGSYATMFWKIILIMLLIVYGCINLPKQYSLCNSLCS